MGAFYIKFNTNQIILEFFQLQQVTGWQ